MYLPIQNNDETKKKDVYLMLSDSPTHVRSNASRGLALQYHKTHFTALIILRNEFMSPDEFDKKTPTTSMSQIPYLLTGK